MLLLLGTTASPSLSITADDDLLCLCEDEGTDLSALSDLSLLDLDDDEYL